MSHMNTYIDSIQLMRVKLPLQVPFKTAHGQINSRSVIILKLNSPTGHSVLSECSALSQKAYHPEILDDSYHCLKNILIPLNSLNKKIKESNVKIVKIVILKRMPIEIIKISNL